MTDRELLETILGKVNGIELKINRFETQQQEDHNILKNLENNSNVNKAEYDNMFNKIAHVEENLKNTDENIDAFKKIIGRHEVDITVLKRRPV